jgi:hypothetical protein
LQVRSIARTLRFSVWALTWQFQGHINALAALAFNLVVAHDNPRLIQPHELGFLISLSLPSAAFGFLSLSLY